MSAQRVRVIPRESIGKGDYRELTPVPVDDVLVLPDTSSEELDGGQLVESRWRIFAPPHFPCRPQDLVEVDGLEPTTLRLHVDGRLQTRADLDGEPHHVEGLLVLWEG